MTIPAHAKSAETLCNELHADAVHGLDDEEALRRIELFGKNSLRGEKKRNIIFTVLAQFKSPIILILLFAALIALFLESITETLIIFFIVFLSGLISAWYEKNASDVVAGLLKIVRLNADVMRSGKNISIPVEEIVPGDVVLLSAGDIVPGDCILLTSKDLFVDESILTGETFPAEKMPGILPSETSPSKRTNMLFHGTHVVGGTARALVVCTGARTEFGKISRALLQREETEFERGIRKFGYLLMEVTLLLVISIFAVNVFMHRPVLDSFLFSLALAVGLTPQLLPAIISVNLSHGARGMAKQKVIVKHLPSIENFGSMNIFCCDKTGTLTMGKAALKKAVDADGNESDKVFHYAYLNSYFETGFRNPIDEAVLQHGDPGVNGFAKTDEIPYDFIRKRLSIAVANGKDNIMVSKGAFKNILEVCDRAENNGGEILQLESVQKKYEDCFANYSAQGFRVLAVAWKKIDSGGTISKNSESGMILLGLLVFEDPVKAGVENTIAELKRVGISFCMITGDNRNVAECVFRQIGLDTEKILTGNEIHQMSDSALISKVEHVRLFAEVEPNQKQRIIHALKARGNVVGYMGDGINDAPALRAADVGISVNTGVDVAKAAADIVLLENNLEVLVNGVREGRITFTNTMKYVFMATSANFGNMFSMAGASLFLPFLPLLPKQILLTNLMTDFPEMTISSDNVDQQMIDRPHRMNVAFIRKFMIVFGAVSSLFDFLTFGVLLFVLKANEIQFRTGWFTESVISASVIVLVIRTRKPFYRSKPGKYLTWMTFVVGVLTLTFPFTPLAAIFSFSPLTFKFLFFLVVILVAYIVTAEMVKHLFYRVVKSI